TGQHIQHLHLGRTARTAQVALVIRIAQFATQGALCIQLRDQGPPRALRFILLLHGLPFELFGAALDPFGPLARESGLDQALQAALTLTLAHRGWIRTRSEERRVGKECRSW